VSPRRLWTAFVMGLRDLLRNRVAVLLLLVVPTVFYAVTLAVTKDSDVPFELASLGANKVVVVPQLHEALVFIGLAAVGVLSGFLAMNLAQRDLDATRRLVLCGYRPAEIVLARLGVLLVAVLVVTTWVGAALPWFFHSDRFPTVAFGLAMGGWVYGCYGLLVGAIFRRELEGVLFVALLANLDAGWLQNPIWYADAQHQSVIRSLPAYFPSQIAMAAAFTDGSVVHPALGALAYGLVFLAAALLVFGLRTRIHR
jgi:ABC-2 type transport system permease protein